MRKSTLFISFILTDLLLALILLWQAEAGSPRRDAAVASCRRVAGRLQLTDLALFTEARYTRNLSLADRFAPFQDHPFALEHFPSGALVSPPPSLRETP